MLYAQTPALRSRQLIGDLTVVGWTVGWVVLARWLHDRILRLAAPGRSFADAGRQFAASLDRAGERIGSLPLAGGPLRAPFTAAGDAGRTLEDAGIAQQHLVARAAIWVPIALAVIPIGYVLLRWAVARLRWVRRANVAAQLLDEGAGLDLFALRALAHQPVSVLREVAVNPAAAWRRGDPDAVAALADLELRGLGLQTR